MPEAGRQARTTPWRAGVEPGARGARRALTIALLLLAALRPAGAQDPAASLDLARPPAPVAAEDFAAPMPDGGTLRLADLRGRVVLLNFWATWCEPCAEEMPAMERLYQAYRERGLAVVALSVDHAGAPPVRTFLTRHALTFPVGLDPRQAVARRFRVWALPASFVLDRDGRVVLQAQGPRAWDSPTARALFDDLLR